MFKASFINSQKLPLVIEPEADSQIIDSDALADLYRRENKFFADRLLERGALLFRGFGVVEAAQFERFVRAVADKNLLAYTGGASPRLELGAGVYTSTEYPPALTLALHNELSYSNKYPSRLYFCCLVAAQTGGETSVGDSRRILKNIQPAVVEEFKRKKVMYVRNLHADAGSGYSWQDAFETDDKTIVENHCRKIGAEFEWRSDNSLRLREIRPATARHPETGEEVWFNQADGFHPSALDAETYQSLISLMPEDEFRLNARFGDDTPINVSVLEHIRDVVRRETVPVKWQVGDVLIVDNVLAAHGRMPFTGARKIILAMT